MIKKISIEGYKSIKELKEFELRPLNVLIGPNKGGKSNFLDALGLLGEAMRGYLSKGLVERGGASQVIWAGGGKSEISISVEGKYWSDQEGKKKINFNIANPFWTYKFDITPMTVGYIINEYTGNEKLKPSEEIKADISEIGSMPVQDFSVRNELLLSQLSKLPPNNTNTFIQSVLSEIIFYDSFDTSRNSKMRNPLIIESSLTKQDITLYKSGDNLTNVYYHLENNHEYGEYWDEICYILASVFPDFKEMKFPGAHGKGAIQFVWFEKYFERPFYPSELSDGTLKFLCLLAILYSPSPPRLVCIDEPDIGLHPQMLDVLAEIITEASEHMQIVITTHSPRFMRNFKPEDIVVVESENGESKFERQDPERLEKWLQSFNLDELWQMGELGGKM